MNTNKYDEILKILTEKMTKRGIFELRESVQEVDMLITAKVELSIKAKEVLDGLSDESKEILMNYYEQSEKIADIHIKHLYLQGAIDCVQLLKKFGILQ